MATVTKLTLVAFILVGPAGIGLRTRVGSVTSAGMWPLILGAALVTSLSTTAVVLVLVFR